MKPVASRKCNRATKLLTTIFGLSLAFSGIVHGIMEISHGNIPTNGMLLEDVGAFTLIPNYLITGIVAVAIGLIIAFWTIFYIGTRHGASVFLLLFISLFLVGGGIAQVPLFLITWGLATRINKPLHWWQKVLPEKKRQQLQSYWRPSLIGCLVMFGIGVVIWLTGAFPGVTDPKTIDYICWSFLTTGLIFFILTIISGFARDIESNNRTIR